MKIPQPNHSKREVKKKKTKVGQSNQKDLVQLTDIHSLNLFKKKKKIINSYLAQ